MKILIADDERDICEAVCKIVERAGHTCLCVYDGALALAAFERERDGLLLHGGGGVVAHLCDGGEGGLGQAEVLKRRTQSASPSVAELDGGRPGSVRIVCGAEESCADHLHL